MLSPAVSLFIVLYLICCIPYPFFIVSQLSCWILYPFFIVLKIYSIFCISFPLFWANILYPVSNFHSWLVENRRRWPFLIRTIEITAELFYQLKVLPLPDLINYKALLFFYDFKGKNLPETFLNEWILNIDRLETSQYNYETLVATLFLNQNTNT